MAQGKIRGKIRVVGGIEMIVCKGCEQEITGEYIVDEKNRKWHIFCRSSQYEDAYQHLCKQEGKPLGKEFINWIKWSGGVTKKQYNENLKLYGRDYYTWGDCCPLCYRKEVVKK